MSALVFEIFVLSKSAFCAQRGPQRKRNQRVLREREVVQLPERAGAGHLLLRGLRAGGEHRLQGLTGRESEPPVGSGRSEG